MPRIQDPLSLAEHGGQIMSGPFEQPLITGNAERHARLEDLEICILLDKVEEVGVCVGIEHDLLTALACSEFMVEEGGARNHYIRKISISRCGER